MKIKFTNENPDFQVTYDLFLKEGQMMYRRDSGEEYLFTTNRWSFDSWAEGMEFLKTNHKKFYIVDAII